MKSSHTSRRWFLRGSAGVMVGLPWLESIPRAAHAGGDSVPKRFVVFMHPQGMIMNKWHPKGTETNFTLSEILQPLAGHQQDIVVISGIDNDVAPLNALSNGHNTAGRTLLTCQPFSANVDGSGKLKPAAQQVANGHAAGPSIDQVLASRIADDTKVRSLDYGIGGTEPFETRMLYADRDDPVSLEANPIAAFDRLFTDDTPDAPTTLERLRSRRKSVLDGVLGQFGHLESRVSASDRHRLQAHADKIREIEKRLEGSGYEGAGCQAPTLGLPADYAPVDEWDNVSSTAFIDLLTMGLACDHARVGTLQFTSYQDPRFPWLDVDIPGPFTNWHEMIHAHGDTGASPDMITAMRWYTSQFASLLQRLDDTPEAEGTLLDHTLVLWVSDFGNGYGHQTNGLPIVLAGNLGGALQTGRWIERNGRTTGDLYTAILNLFGFEDQSFGLPDVVSGPLPL